MLTGMAKPQIAVIVGSNRVDSSNQKLARALVRLGADKFRAKFVEIDDLPMYAGSRQMPPKTRDFISIVAHAFLRQRVPADCRKHSLSQTSAMGHQRRFGPAWTTAASPLKPEIVARRRK